MAARFNPKIIAAAVLFAVLATSFWVYSAYKKREASKATAAWVADSGHRLRDAVGILTAPPTMNRTQFLKKLEEHANTVDANLQNFRKTGSVPRPLADAADDYLLTARELLKRVTDSQRYRLLFSESSQALLDHMNRDNRTASWIQEAVKAKERMNKDYRGYTLAMGAFDKLLDSLATSQQKIAPYADKAVLIEDSLISQARARGQDDVRSAAAEFEKISRIAAPK